MIAVATNSAAGGGVGAPNPTDGALNRTNHQNGSSLVTVPVTGALRQTEPVFVP